MWNVSGRPWEPSDDLAEVAAWEERQAMCDEVDWLWA
jgi:hypothetical protein